MGKYWKLVGVVLVVAILAAVMVAAVPAAKPDQGDTGPDLASIINLGAVDIPDGT